MANYTEINTEDYLGERLDVFIFNKLKEVYPQYTVTRSFIANNQDKFILVNGESKKKGYTLRANDRVEINLNLLRDILEKDQNPEIIAQEGKLDIVYEDDHMLVINKKKGMVVHLGDGNKEHTLVNYLKYYFESKGIDCSGMERCGLVHRLDKGVSGLMVIAKDRATQLYLKSRFEKHEVVKVYKAKVVGDINNIAQTKLNNAIVSSKDVKEELDEYVKGGLKIDTSWNRVEGYIKRDKVNRKRMKFSKEKEGGADKYALSYMKFFKNNEVLVKIETGRMHQIRASLKFLGLVIEGDMLYATGAKNSNAISLESVLLQIVDVSGNVKLWRLV